MENYLIEKKKLVNKSELINFCTMYYILSSVCSRI